MKSNNNSVDAVECLLCLHCISWILIILFKQVIHEANGRKFVNNCFTKGRQKVFLSKQSNVWMCTSGCRWEFETKLVQKLIRMDVTYTTQILLLIPWFCYEFRKINLFIQHVVYCSAISPVLKTKKEIDRESVVDRGALADVFFKARPVYGARSDCSFKNPV